MVAAVVAVLSGLLLLLAVPVEVAFRVRGIDALGGQIAVRWLFGLVRFRVVVPDAARPSARRSREKPPVSKREKKSTQRGRRGGALAVLRQSAFRQRLIRLARDLARAAHFHELGLRMRLGLGDPADTGRLWAIVGPLSVAAQRICNARVCIEPAFMEAVLDFDAHGRMRVVPVHLFALAIAFAISPPSVRAWRTLRARDA